MHFRLAGSISGGVTSRPTDRNVEEDASFELAAGSLGVIAIHLGRIKVVDGRTTTPFRAEVDVDPPGDVKETFNLLAQHRLIAAADLSRDDDAWLRLHVDGVRIEPGFVVPIRFLPAAFRDFVVPLEADLREAAFRVVRVIRWVYGLPGLAEPLAVTSREWSLDAREWMSLPYEQPKPARGYATPEPLATAEETAAIQGLLDTNADEPAGRLLWLVASANRSREPRAALAMAAAAAEVGMRYALRARVSRKKLREMNVKELLSGVMELALTVAVPAGLPPVFPPQKLRDRILKTAAQRNSLVHEGIFRVPPAEMDLLLDAAENLLWILDYLTGYRAAIRRITSDVLTDIGNPLGLTAGDLIRAVTT